jgi:hypothetical protein
MPVAAGYPPFMIIISNCQQLIPGVVVHFGTTNYCDYERSLYNTVRFELQETIRAYLRRTRQPHPIHLVFDMS